MDQSLTKTLARKHHTSVQHICDQYKAELNVDGVIYKGLRVVVPREGKKPLVATWGGIPLRWDIQANLEDQPELRWNSRSELEKRLLAQVCEQCGATFLTDLIEVHHIRALKDLTKYEGRQKPLWVPHHGSKTSKNAGPLSNVSPGPPRWTSTDATKIKLLNRNSLTMLESRMPGNSHVRFGGGHTEKGNNAPRWVPTLPLFPCFLRACDAGYGWDLFSDSLVASCVMPPWSMWNCIPSMIALSIATWHSFVSVSMRLLLNSPRDAFSVLPSVLPVAFFPRKSIG